VKPVVVVRGETAVGKRTQPDGALRFTAAGLLGSGHGELRAHGEQFWVHAAGLRDDDLDPVVAVGGDEHQLVARRVLPDEFRQGPEAGIAEARPKRSCRIGQPLSLSISSVRSPGSTTIA